MNSPSWGLKTMKQVFFDKSQSVVIKVFPNSRLLERELCGAKNLKKAALVPQIEKLDRKVAKISLLQGFLGYQINEIELNVLVAQFLKRVAVQSKIIEFSIMEEIVRLEDFFQGDQQSLLKLKIIKQQVKEQALVPIHGDLQKQNIIINEGKLGLIDFEHFVFAPKELEICNSLFYNDGNCLNVPGVLKNFPSSFFNRDILKLMLMFYRLKQVSLGLGQNLAEKKFKLALAKVDKLPFKRGDISSEGSSYYFA